MLTGTANIVQAHEPSWLEPVRKLFREYADSLDFDLCFQNFAQELQQLPGYYSPPSGRLLLALREGGPVGCIAMRPLSDGICEIKRLYVRPEFRRMGVGKQLVEAIIAAGREQSYQIMRLDTVASMVEAITLYKYFGFHSIRPYCQNPLPSALYFELRLH